MTLTLDLLQQKRTPDEYGRSSLYQKQVAYSMYLFRKKANFYCERVVSTSPKPEDHSLSSVRDLLNTFLHLQTSGRAVPW